MKRLRFVIICLLVPVVYGVSSERKLYKRQSPGGSPPINYGPQQGQPLPFGVTQPRIAPTYGNDKGGGDYQNYEDSNTLPGNPGTDYPIYGPNPPQTNFNCMTAPYVPGYYANVDYACQVFHICEEGGKVNTFLCPNGTIYNQKFFVCDWWYNVNCAEATSYYGLNGELYKAPPGGYNQGGYVSTNRAGGPASGIYLGGPAAPIVPPPPPPQYGQQPRTAVGNRYGNRGPSSAGYVGPTAIPSPGYVPAPAPAVAQPGYISQY